MMATWQKVVITCTALTVLGSIAIVAMMNGINGQLRSSVIGAVCFIMGRVWMTSSDNSRRRKK